MEKEFLKRYYNSLVELGVKNYSWDECRYDYKLLLILNLYRIVGRWTRKFSSNFWFRLESSFVAIEKLNCMELLD
jgi:hypothetical protein